jgi:hypothetical protein
MPVSPFNPNENHQQTLFWWTEQIEKTSEIETMRLSTAVLTMEASHLSSNGTSQSTSCVDYEVRETSVDG